MLLGTAAFFVPFIFKFMLIAMIIGMLFRMFAYHRRRHFSHRFNEYYANSSNQMVPIDGQWYKPNIQSSGIENNINVNY